MAVSNPQAANTAAAALHSQRETESNDLANLDETRQQLEAPAGPTPDDDAPATATDGGDTAGFAMAADRRVGSIAIDVDGHGSIRFGKPSGRSSTQILSPIEEMEDNDDSLVVLGDYLWATLAEWSLDEAHDTDFWADEIGLFDALAACRQLALGGNAPEQ